MVYEMRFQTVDPAKRPSTSIFIAQRSRDVSRPAPPVDISCAATTIRRR